MLIPIHATTISCSKIGKPGMERVSTHDVPQGLNASAALILDPMAKPTEMLKAVVMLEINVIMGSDRLAWRANSWNNFGSLATVAQRAGENG